MQACRVTDLQLLHEVLLQVRSLLLEAHVGVALLWCCGRVLRHLLPFRNPLMLLLLLVQRLPVVLLRCCRRPDCLAHIWHPSYPCRMGSHLLPQALTLMCQAEYARHQPDEHCGHPGGAPPASKTGTGCT